jgi:hypothetical protein
VKASTRKTPQPSPASHSAIRHLQGDLAFLGTPERVSALRGACLVRDRHRCVITRRFDLNEANSRAKLASREGTVARDDDGNPFDNTTSFSALEVAHIIPHSLTRLNASNELVRITLLCHSPDVYLLLTPFSHSTPPKLQPSRFLICSTTALHT